MGEALRTAPWRRAPTLLLRRPSVFLAIFAAALVVSIAASSGVLFLATLGAASLQAQAADECPEAAMPQFSVFAPTPRLEQSVRTGVSAMRRTVAIGDPYAVAIASTAVAATNLTLFVRDGALDHVHTLTPRDGRPGAWLPETFAAESHAKPGDVLTTRDGRPLPVAGIYRDLSRDPFHVTNLPRYWCSWDDMILKKILATPPPLLLTDLATIKGVLTQFNFFATHLTVYNPLPINRMSIDAADSAAARASPAGRVLLRAKPLLGVTNYGSGRPPVQELHDKVVTARRIRAGLVGSVVPIDLAGTFVALLLLAGAGGFWATHRAREIRLLTSRGVGPADLGLKAVLETAPAALLGLLVGVFAARAMVHRVGPATVFEPDALAIATLAACVAVLVGLALIYAIGALAARERRIRQTRRWRWAHVPWELLLVGVAVSFALALRATSGVRVEHAIVEVRPQVLLFPLFGAAGALFAAGRLLWLALPWLARLGRRLPRGGYLTARRIGRSRFIAVGLLVGTALPCALLTYPSAVVTGVQHEITSKYQTNLGAAHVLNLIGVHEATPRLNNLGTAVVTYPVAAATLADGTQVSVLGIDLATFEHFAFLSASQRADVARLRNGGPRAALLINAPTGLGAIGLRIGSTMLPLTVVARSDIFPGLRNGAYPMVVLPRGVLAHVDPAADRANQAWTTADEVPALTRAVLGAGYSVLGEVDPDVVVSTTGLLPITWIFGYLRALAVLVGLVAATGVVFGLAARTRRRTVAYVMSRRMGLSQATQVRSLLLEIGFLVGIGWLAGVAAGGAGFAIIVSGLDIYPRLPPGPSLTFSSGVFIGTGIAAALVILVATVATHRLAERADPAAVLRME